MAVVKDKVLVGCGDGKISFIELNTEECHQTLNVGGDKDEMLYYCEHTGGNLVSCIKIDGTRIFSCV